MQEWHRLSALALGAGIAEGRIDPAALAEHFLERIARLDSAHAVYLRTTPQRARAEAEAARARAKAGRRLGPLDGVPLAWKDLFDTAGTLTTFASPLLADRVPDQDALVVRRAANAGMVCLGKTNLTEFAYSGLGINPTFGTPANAHDAQVPRVPGGSSSGSGVAVARGLAPLAIGSDTGGSVRIPASLNGLVGLKVTHGLVPMDGALPLSPSLDTAGPLALDVADAAAMFGVLADCRAPDLAGASLKGARLLVPETVAYDGLDDAVAAAMEDAEARLHGAGAILVREPVPEFQELLEMTARHGNIISAEGYAIWHDLFEARGEEMYWGVKSRFDMAKSLSAIDAERAHLQSAALADRLHRRLAGYAAALLPTAPILPPAVADLQDQEEAYNRANVTLTRNTRLGNLLRCCAVSLPCRAPGDLPVGLTLMTAPFREGALLRLAAAAEPLIRPEGKLPIE